MSYHGRPARAATSFVVAGLALIGSAPAFAGTVAPSDSYSTGYVGLCNQQGKNVTSGSVYAKPFVWRAVSSVEAPQPFNSAGRKATLYAFQPRPGVDASEWSGNILTAATPYTNARAPMVQSNHRDFGLSDYLNEYPPEVNGIVELRIEYSSTDTGFSTAYAASFIKVTGTTWHLLKGGPVNCTAGSATSPEASLPKYDKAGLQPPELLSPVAAKAVGAPTDRAANLAARDVALGKKAPAAATSAASQPGTTTATPGAQSAPGAGSPAANSTGASSGGGSHVALIASVVIALAVLGAAVTWWLRSRPVRTARH